MRFTHLFTVLAAMLLLAACGGQAAQSQAPAGGAVVDESMPMATAAAAAEPAPASIEEYQGDGATGNTTGQAEQPAGQRLVIKNADLSIEVESVAAAEQQLRARVDQLGGYVVSVQTSGSDEYLSSVVTFRVPSVRFEEALSGVEGLAHKVLSRGVSGQDVTEEFVDLEARLRNLEATRDRLLDLLTRATRVEDALQVNQALTDVQGQIEQIKGRMQYLTQSSALSTITADLQPMPPPPTIIDGDAWQPLRVAGEALAGLVVFGQSLVNLGIVLVVWSPVWLPLLLLGRWGFFRLTGRRRPAPTPPSAS